MKTKIIVALLIAAFVVAASIVIAAGPGGGKGGPMGPGMMKGGHGCGMGMDMLPQLKNELKLTQDQMDQMSQLHEGFMKDTQATREKLMAKCKEMTQLWFSGDAAAFKAQFGEIDALKMEMRDSAVDYAFRARQVLTADQVEKLRLIMKDKPGCGMGMCGACMGCGMGMGMGPGGMRGGQGMGPGPGATPGACPSATQ